MADDLKVNVDALVLRWPNLSSSQQHDFAHAFAPMREFSPNDERILTFLMEAGDDVVWHTISLALTRHSNEQLVTQFLIDRITQTSTCSKMNYYQAAEIIADQQFVPILEIQFKKQSERVVASWNEVGPQAELERLEFLRLCRTLLTITGEIGYRDAIRRFWEHPSERVRKQAHLYLQEK